MRSRICLLYTSIPMKWLNPIVFMFCAVGTFAINNNIYDVFLMIGAGIVGYAVSYTHLDVYKRQWWLCDKGHSFCAVIAHRVNKGSDCPYCTNRKVLPGFNDLETKEPVSYTHLWCL